MGIIISPHRPVTMIKQDSLHKVLSTVPVCRSIVVVIVELPKITQAIRSSDLDPAIVIPNSLCVP